MKYTPGYIKLYETGELQRRAERLWDILNDCVLCPHVCKVNRIKGEKGICRMGNELRVSSAFPHFGEEPPLVGYYGSGTIFFCGCNLHCIFCQNYDISHLERGWNVTISDLSRMMMELQNRGCHNINFVTPTHYVPHIIKALTEAVEKGLNVPLVYNCGGYESAATLKKLDGIIDIYMPDTKFASNSIAEVYTEASNYATVMKKALKEMYRQVGDLVIDERGIALKGLLARHLVMPEGVAGTGEIIKYIASNISRNTYLNVMEQYRPCYKAMYNNRINRRITASEFREAVELAQSEGITRGLE
ncbi:MAG: radical SAM protein [Fidelibacterota bacterium]